MEITEQLKNRIGELNGVDYKALTRSEEFGRDYAFAEPSATLEKIKADLNAVLEYADVLRIPDAVEKQVAAIVERTLDAVNRIREFKLKDNEANASAEHSQIHGIVKSLYQEDLELLVPLIERAENKKLGTKEAQAELLQAVKSAKQIKDIQTEAEKLKDDLGTTIKDIRASLGTEGAKFSSKDFEDQANEYKHAASRWFKASVVAILIFVVAAFLLFHMKMFSLEGLGNEYGRIAQISLFKVVILSVGYLVVYQCIKNYKVNKHLFVVNRHRQLALTVYPLMTGAASDKEQSNIILGQAVKAIFDPANSGYLDGEENPNPVNLTGVVNKIIDKTQ